MRIALAIMGTPRMFSETYKPVREFILDKYDSKTFASIFEPCSEREYERNVWLYPKRSYFRHNFLQEFAECYGPIAKMDCRVFIDELPRLVKESEDLPRSTGRTYCHRAVYSQLECWARAADLIKPVANEYDLVIKYRTDVMIREWNVTLDMMEAMASTDMLYIASSNGMGWAVGPHGECGLGIHEVMWIGRPETHLKAASMFHHLQEYCRELGTIKMEPLFGLHVKRMGLETSTFPVELWCPDAHDLWPFLGDENDKPR